MPKQKRNRYVGAYREPAAPPIDVPFTIASLRDLLADGARADGCYTHQQIKDWADRFWWTQSQQPFDLGLDIPPDVEKAADLAQDVVMQWDIFLANTYTLPELQHLDFALVRLPEAWFAEWLARLRHSIPSDISE